MFFYYKRTDNKLQERAKSLHPPQILRRNKQGKSPQKRCSWGLLVRVVRLERTVSWSQTRRDTNFAIPGYSLFCHDTTESGKNKDFSVCGHLCGQSRFYAVFNDWGKSRKRRRRKALRRFTLPCPGYRHGTPKCRALPVEPHPVIHISTMLPRRGVKIKFFLSMVIPVVKAAFVPFSAIGGNPANAGVARLCGVSPHAIPDTATALPMWHGTNSAIPG